MNLQKQRRRSNVVRVGSSVERAEQFNQRRTSDDPHEQDQEKNGEESVAGALESSLSPLEGSLVGQNSRHNQNQLEVADRNSKQIGRDHRLQSGHVTPHYNVGNCRSGQHGQFSLTRMSHRKEEANTKSEQARSVILRQCHDSRLLQRRLDCRRHDARVRVRVSEQEEAPQTTKCNAKVQRDAEKTVVGTVLDRGEDVGHINLLLDDGKHSKSQDGSPHSLLGRKWRRKFFGLEKGQAGHQTHRVRPSQQHHQSVPQPVRRVQKRDKRGNQKRNVVAKANPVGHVEGDRDVASHIRAQHLLCRTSPLALGKERKKSPNTNVRKSRLFCATPGAQ